MRVVLFLAVLGVISQGVTLDPKNPASTPFYHVAGNIGYHWYYHVGSIHHFVIGAAYTSVS